MTVAESARRVLGTEPARPAWVRARPRAYRYAVVAVCLGAFMGQLDASIVTVAVPSIQHDLHQGVGAVVWVGLAYLVALVATVTVVGRLSDTIGRKAVYLEGFAVFTAASALCAVAPNLGVLIACRVLQGVGAAMLQANSVAIISLAVPRERLARALGVQGAAQALGLAAGPSVGGLLLALGGWRLLFLVNVPTGIAAFALAWCLLPRSTELHEPSRVDPVGVVTLAGATGALLCALTLGGDRVVTVPSALALVVAAAVLTWVLWRHERRAAAPLVDRAVLSLRAVRFGVSAAVASYVVLFGVLLATPFLLLRELRLGTLGAGATLAVLPIAVGIAAPLAGHLAERVGTRRLALGGTATCAAGLCALAATHSSVVLVAAGLALVGAGLGVFTPANNTSVMSAVPRRSAGVASGLLNLGRGLGTALGLAVVSAVLGAIGTSGTAAGRAFTSAMLVLVAFAVLAAVLSSGRRAPNPRALDGGALDSGALDSGAPALAQR